MKIVKRHFSFILLFLLIAPATLAQKNLDTLFIHKGDTIEIRGDDSSGFFVSAIHNSNLLYSKFSDSVSDLKPMLLEAKDTIDTYFDTTSIKHFNELTFDSTTNQVKVIQYKPEFDWLRYIIPLLTFILGFFGNIQLDKHKVRKERNRVGQRWLAEIKALPDLVENQVNVLKSSCVEINSNFPTMTKIKIIQPLSCSFTEYLDKSLFFSYLNEGKGLDLNTSTSLLRETDSVLAITIKLYSQIQHTYSLSQNKVSEFYNKINSECALLSNSILEFQIIYTSTDNPNGILPSTNYENFLELSETHFIAFVENSNPSPLNFKTNYLMPAQECLNGFLHNEKVHEIYLRISTIRNLLAGLNAEKEYLKSSIKDLIGQFNNNKDSILTLLQNLENNQSLGHVD